MRPRAVARRDVSAKSLTSDSRRVACAATARGSYASAEDVAKVYAAGVAHRAESHAVRIRISFDDMADARAANEVYECTPASVYDRRRGGRALYFEAIVPKVPVPVR